MYGRQPLLPIDIEFGVFTPDVTGVATQKYVQMLKHQLEWAYNKAREVSTKEAKRSKRRYDQKVRCSKLDIGDIVMVRQKGFTGKHKVADRWEKDYYEVISQKPSRIPVFVIKSLGENGGEKTLHMIGTVYLNIPLSSASLHGHPRSSLGATLGVCMSATAYGNLSTMSCVWPIGASRLNLRPHPYLYKVGLHLVLVFLS